MNTVPKSQAAVIRRRILLGAGILVIATLTLGIRTPAMESSALAASALQVTATPSFQPGTTVTPIPGLPVPPSGPAFQARKVLQGLVLALLLFGALFMAFRRPEARNPGNGLGVSIGLLGWFLVNTFLWRGILQNEPGALFLNPGRIVPLLVNLACVPLLFRLQRWVALGLICAILANAIGLLVFPMPTADIVHTDPTAERIGVMMPFYIPFFFPNP